MIFGRIRPDISWKPDPSLPFPGPVTEATKYTHSGACWGKAWHVPVKDWCRRLAAPPAASPGSTEPHPKAALRKRQASRPQNQPPLAAHTQNVRAGYLVYSGKIHNTLERTLCGVEVRVQLKVTLNN